MKENNIQKSTTDTRLDLRPPETKKLNDINWPTDYQIISKIKRETIPVAFRIDEVTNATLCEMARRNDISVSALVNEIINSYVEQCSTLHRPFNHVLETLINNHMSRLCSKMQKMSKAELHEMANGYYYMGEPAPSVILGSIWLDSGVGNNATYEHYTSTCYEDSIPRYACYFNDEVDVIHIPFPSEKWDIVSIILSNYGNKIEQYQHPNTLEKLNFESIVDTINSHSGKDLILALVEQLKLSLTEQNYIQ